LEAGLELIDYKSTKQINLPQPAEIDLQMGLYYLALEQRYDSGLRKLSLLYLRSGEKISFDASPKQKQQVEVMVGEIGCRLRTDALWEATTG
jgi:putative RecB family exonuclease